MDEKPAILFSVIVLVLAGNVLLPVWLYWAISLIAHRMPKTSSDLIAARYFLLNGRTSTQICSRSKKCGYCLSYRWG